MLMLDISLDRLNIRQGVFTQGVFTLHAMIMGISYSMNTAIDRQPTIDCQPTIDR